MESSAKTLVTFHSDVTTISSKNSQNSKNNNVVFQVNVEQTPRSPSSKQNGDLQLSARRLQGSTRGQNKFSSLESPLSPSSKQNGDLQLSGRSTSPREPTKVLVIDFDPNTKKEYFVCFIKENQEFAYPLFKFRNPENADYVLANEYRHYRVNLHGLPLQTVAHTDLLLCIDGLFFEPVITSQFQLITVPEFYNGKMSASGKSYASRRVLNPDLLTADYVDKIMEISDYCKVSSKNSPREPTSVKSIKLSDPTEIYQPKPLDEEDHDTDTECVCTIS
jgi:hypothetical protein